jgi:hypothetical protein
VELRGLPLRRPRPHRRLNFQAAAFPGGEVCSGAFALLAGSVDGLTNVEPEGHATTAWPVADPFRYCGQVRNHSVHPLSHTPDRGLLLMVIGSPGTARL